MIATELAHSGTSMRLAISLPPARPIPTPNSAVASGRPMATSDPNATSRIRAAIASPGPSAPMLLDCTFSIACPDSSTWTPSARAWLARSTIWAATSTGKRAPVVSSWTTAYPVVPSAETWLLPASSHGCDHVDDVGQLAYGGHEWLGHGAHSGGGHAVVVVDDHGDRVAGPVGEPLVEELDRGLGVGAR